MKRFLNILIDTMVGNRNGELSDGIEVAIGFFSAIGIGCTLTYLYAWLTGGYLRQASALAREQSGFMLGKSA